MIHLLLLLTNFFNRVFPETLKMRKALAIYKSGNSGNISNYRPISLLLILSKILKKLFFEYNVKISQN